MKRLFLRESVVLCTTALVYAIFIISCKHEEVTAPQPQKYFPQVKQIIAANCIVCHTPGGQGQPIDFTSDETIVNDAALIKAATVDPASPRNRRMPPTGDLSDADKQIITAWFEKGGKSTD